MDDAAFAELDRIIERRMAAANTPGLALALTDRERTLRVATYGFADLAARTPVTPDTLFEIGSIGKSFTSLALLREHEAGNLDLQAPVARHRGDGLVARVLVGAGRVEQVVHLVVVGLVAAHDRQVGVVGIASRNEKKQPGFVPIDEAGDNADRHLTPP